MTAARIAPLISALVLEGKAVAKGGEPDRAEGGGRKRAVFARHAASLLLLREGSAGLEVLMGRRTGGHRFMPNLLVFPGGAVDREDGVAAASAEPDPALLATLRRSCGPRLARGIAVCAARELREETGLSLGEPPRLDGLRYLCRAVTPPESPIRFNARFLMLGAEAAEGEPADSAELSEVGFRPVEAALHEDLALVTREVLLRLQAFRQASDEPGGAPWMFRRRRWTRDH